MVEQVVLVDEQDVAVGTLEKQAAHQRGALHRAVSVFVFDAAGRLLLQRRAASKYHSAGLWTNTCCSHPRPGEDVAAAAQRRLGEEMGFDCALERAGSFLYRAVLDHGLTEHELDHLFVGRFDGVPAPDPAEVGEWRWASLAGVRRDLAQRPEAFSAWFPLALARLLELGFIPPSGDTAHSEGGDP